MSCTTAAKGTTAIPEHETDAGSYAWTITVDRVFDGDDENTRQGLVSTDGDGGYLSKLVQRSGAHRVRFKLYDDDGEFYYAGFLTYDPARCTLDDAASAPLDWAVRDAGAARIEFPERPDLNIS